MCRRYRLARNRLLPPNQWYWQYENVVGCCETSSSQQLETCLCSWPKVGAVEPSDRCWFVAVTLSLVYFILYTCMECCNVSRKILTFTHAKNVETFKSSSNWESSEFMLYYKCAILNRLCIMSYVCKYSIIRRQSSGAVGGIAWFLVWARLSHSHPV